MSTRPGRLARLAGVSLGLVGLLATSVNVTASAEEAPAKGSSAETAYMRTPTPQQMFYWAANTFHGGDTDDNGISDDRDANGDLTVAVALTEDFDGSRGQDKAVEYRPDFPETRYGAVRFTNRVAGVGQSADVLLDFYRPASGCPGQIENCADPFGFFIAETEEYRYPAADVVTMQYDTKAVDPATSATEASLMVDSYWNGDYDRSGADRAIFFPARVAPELVQDVDNGFHRYVATDERHEAWQIKTRVSNGTPISITAGDDACDLGSDQYCTWSEVVGHLGLNSQIATLRLGNGFSRTYDQDVSTPGVQAYEVDPFDTLADNFIVRMDTRGARQGYPQNGEGAAEFYRDLNQLRLDEEEYHRGGGYLEPFKGWNFESHSFIAPGFQPPRDADGNVDFSDDAQWARMDVLNENIKMTQFGAYSYGTLDGVSVDDMANKGFYVRITESQKRPGETTFRPIPFQRFDLRQLNGAPAVSPMSTGFDTMSRDLCRIETTDANGIGFCEFTGSEESLEAHIADPRVQAAWIGPMWRKSGNNTSVGAPGGFVYDVAPVALQYGTF